MPVNVFTKDTADSLISLLTQILDYSRIASPRMELFPVDFNFLSLITSIRTVFRTQAEEKGIGFSVAIDPDVPAFLEGDPDRLKQILTNLIGNAVKFTSRGDVSVAIRVSGEYGDSILLEFVVRDTGIGIPKEKIRSIFQTFSQVEERPIGPNRGVGLGLAITRRLVSLMGGKLSVESTQDKGTAFTITIRFRKKSEYAQPLEPTVSDEGLKSLESMVFRSRFPAAGEQVKILVAEDDTINRLYVCKILADAGFSVTSVTNGRDVLTALTAKPFDLILMDGRMPELDGFETTRAIRSDYSEPCRTIPIIAFTAYTAEEDKKRFFEAGMDDYVCKPVNERLLLKKIAALTAAKISVLPVQS